MKFTLFLFMILSFGGEMIRAADVATAEKTPELLIEMKEEPPKVTEAERCEAKLMEVHKKSLADKLQIVVWNMQHIDAAIQNMKVAGEIQDAQTENRIRMQLTVGSILSSEGLLHEAVYRVFKGRYKTNAEITDALRGFKNISQLKDKMLLLSEVIERVLQYIPDVDTGNVNKIKETAAFVGMNEDQLQNFRNKWMVYDQMDNFVEILQGGILALLTASTDEFVQDVLARGKFSFSRTVLFWRSIEIPNKPAARNETLNTRQIRIENMSYYDDENLNNYIKKSSSAARRFFIMDRLDHLTIEQMQSCVDKKNELWLKESLVQALQNEIQWRLVLRQKFAVMDSHRRDEHEIRTTIARLENRKPYDLNTFQKALKGLREANDQALLQKSATEMLDQYFPESSPEQYINILTSIINATNSRLTSGSSKPALAIIEAAVRNINAMGMITDHAVKAKRVLTDLGSRLTGNGPGEANKLIDQIVTETPKYGKLTLEQLKAELITVTDALNTASTDLENAYGKRCPSTFGSAAR